MEALGLALEVEARLLASGIPAAALPPRPEIFAACWRPAKRLVKLRKRAAAVRVYAEQLDERAVEAARDARDAVDRVEAFWRQVAGQQLRRLVDFDVTQWHLSLAPCPASADDLRREAA